VTAEDDARRDPDNPSENRGEEDQKDQRDAAVAEDPPDSNAAGVLHDEDHEQHQRSCQKRRREIQRCPATVAAGPRLTGLLNLVHERRLPGPQPSKRIGQFPKFSLVAHRFSGTHRHLAVVVNLNDKAAPSAHEEPPQ
jgi:hypothetical protein